MGSRQIVLVSTTGFSVLNTGIFWREAKTKRLFSQCMVDIVKGGGRALYTPPWADFSIMMECRQESGHCESSAYNY